MLAFLRACFPTVTWSWNLRRFISAVFWVYFVYRVFPARVFVERINVLTYQYRGVSVKCFQLSSSRQKTRRITHLVTIYVLTRRFVSRLSHRENSSGSLGIPPDISRRNELGKTTKITKIQEKQRSSITRRNPLFNDFPPRRLRLHLTRERCTMWPTSDVSIGQVFDYYSEKGKPVWSLLVFSEHGLEVPFVFRFYLFDLGFPTVTLKFAAL